MWTAENCSGNLWTAELKRFLNFFFFVSLWSVVSRKIFLLEISGDFRRWRWILTVQTTELAHNSTFRRNSLEIPKVFTPRNILFSAFNSQTAIYYFPQKLIFPSTGSISNSAEYRWLVLQPCPNRFNSVPTLLLADRRIFTKYFSHFKTIQDVNNQTKTTYSTTKDSEPLVWH